MWRPATNIEVRKAEKPAKARKAWRRRLARRHRQALKERWRQLRLGISGSWQK